MSFSPDSLLRQLDRTEIIDWAPELKNGRESYVFLLAALKEGKLNVSQISTLYMLFFEFVITEIAQKFCKLSLNL